MYFSQSFFSKKYFTGLYFGYTQVSLTPVNISVNILTSHSISIAVTAASNIPNTERLIKLSFESRDNILPNELRIFKL